MQEFLKKNSTPIVIGLISTMLFLYVLQPLLELIGNFSISVASSISSVYVDKIYSQIAHLEIMNYGYFFYMLFVSCFSIVTIAITVTLWKEESKNLITETKDHALDQDELLKLESKRQPKRRNKKIRFTVISSVITVLSITTISTKTYQLSLLSSFKQHLRIVAPYIDEQKEEKILSDWSLMQSKTDYISIYVKLNEIAKDNNIELPDNTIYSINSI